MRTHRTALLVIVICTVSASAKAFEIFDPANFFEHQLQNGWRATIGVLMDLQLVTIHQMAQRLSAFTHLTKYVADDIPQWRTHSVDRMQQASATFMAALNSGDTIGIGYLSIARSRVPPSAALTKLGGNDMVAVNALRSALATIDVAASAIIAGADQTGRIRGNYQNEVDTIAALEQDVIDPDSNQSATAVMEKVSAALLIRSRQQETRMELVTALTEQLLLDAKRDRDTEAAVVNMQFGRLTRGRAVASSLLDGAAMDLRSWRQP